METSIDDNRIVVTNELYSKLWGGFLLVGGVCALLGGILSSDTTGYIGGLVLGLPLTFRGLLLLLLDINQRLVINKTNQSLQLFSRKFIFAKPEKTTYSLEQFNSISFELIRKRAYVFQIKFTGPDEIAAVISGRPNFIKKSSDPYEMQTVEEGQAREIAQTLGQSLVITRLGKAIYD